MQRAATSSLSGKLRERDEAFDAQIASKHAQSVAELRRSTEGLVEGFVAELRAEEHRNSRKLLQMVDIRLGNGAQAQDGSGTLGCVNS